MITRIQTYSHGVVEPKTLVKSTNSLKLSTLKIKVRNLQVLRKTSRIITLRNNSNLALRSPTQQHLSRSPTMLLGNPLDSSMLKQQRRILRMLKIQLKETQRPKRRISSNSKTLALRVIHQPSLRQVRVVLDLQGRRPNTRIAQQIHQQLRAEVAHANAAGELLVDQRLHSRPRLVDGRVGQLDLTVGC